MIWGYPHDFGHFQMLKKLEGQLLKFLDPPIEFPHFLVPESHPSPELQVKLLVTEPRQASEMQEAARQFMAGPGAWDRLGPLANSLCGDPLSAWNVSIFWGLNGETPGFVLEDLMGFKMSKRRRKRLIS